MSESNMSGSGNQRGAGTSSKAPTSRLPSFRAPRDLTLSASSAGPAIKPNLGAARPRKNFTPNIPIRREKHDKLSDEKQDKPFQSKHRDRERREGGRGRGNKEFVQTTGSLFGEGIASSTLRRTMTGSFVNVAGGGGGGGNKGDAGFISKPKLNLENLNNIDKEHEDQKLKELLRGDFIDDSEDGIKEDSDLIPVQLPMVDTGRGFKEENNAEKDDVKKKIAKPLLLNDGTTVKHEPKDSDDDEPKGLAPQEKKSDVKETGLPICHDQISELTIPQLLSSQQSHFMFLQLPNCLPSHPPEVKQELSISQPSQQTKPSQEAQGDGDDEANAKNQFCTLNTLPEGQIGTLRVYESGHTELWLGGHKLEITKGTQVGFLQDVVSVETDAEAKTGNMTVLGHIRHRLVCAPDFESLLTLKPS
ncbi:RNA polymerase III subunit C53 [Oratosquilla oratoria]|uniref:RNA polymerase III subunit C53 n=1 Tax=Oratosquilla oratoria TaxID=337810 RepID=UPI003F770348